MKQRILSLLMITMLSLLAPAVAADDNKDVDTILADAATRLDETESMSFVMELEGTTYVDGPETIELLGAEGVMQRPDKVDVTFKAEVLGSQQISIRMITIGDQSWITDIVTGKWVDAPEEFGYNPAVLYDDEHGLGPVMSRMENPELQGTEEINGREAYHITAEVEGVVTSEMTSGTMQGSRQTLEIWIDVENSDLLQVSIAEPDDEDIDDPATWTLILSDHNKDVTIEQPD